MKAMIFGAGGQDGFYLKQECESRGIETFPLSGSEFVDVSLLSSVGSSLARIQPDIVFQLGAVSSTSHDALWGNHQAITTGTLNVLESVHRDCPSTKVVVIGSGVQFKNDGSPINEATPFEASSPYALARIHTTYAARYYRTLGLRAYVAYLFHHESPRRPTRHVSRIVAEAAKRISRGDGVSFEIGDPSVEREWVYAGDVTRALVDLVLQDEVMEAVIGSGDARSVSDWCDACFSAVGLRWQDHVKTVPGYTTEYSRLVSDPSRIMSLGWRPKVSLGELARMMVS